MKRIVLLISFLIPAIGSALCQTFDLQQLLKENRLDLYASGAKAITDGTRKGITANGITWLRDVSFTDGTIELDLRGKDVFQQSFIGIGFHGIDTTTYDAIYFRPFNFNSADPVRKIHAVQYVAQPDFPWYRLREERNGQYEKAVTPVPGAEEWFHARIVIKGDDINVYVNNSMTPSLTVKKLNARRSGKIGICSFGELPGDFANLEIKK